MALSLLSQARALRARLEADNRHVEIAGRFAVHRREGEAVVPTGERSPVYGGRFDTWARRYVDEARPRSVVELPCSESQFALVVDDSPRIEANGGRGSGKSEGGVLRALRCILEWPGMPGEIVSPTFKLTKIVWGKMLAQIPRAWLQPGALGIARGERELTFINGSHVRFASADNPDSLRSWGGGWAFIDEEQDVTTEAIDIVWPSLRLTSTPRLWTCGTPKLGEYAERHRLLLEDAEARVHRFDSFSNPFISHRVFELARRQMDERTYRQEILAEWVFDEVGLVAVGFTRQMHGMTLERFRFARDITHELTMSRARRPFKFIGGVDYNWNTHDRCVIYRVFEGTPPRWYAIDQISAPPPALNLAQELMRRGYGPGDILIVDDASGDYNSRTGYPAPNSSSRIMRQMGYTVLHPRKNPDVLDRVNAFLVKLKPASGDPSWFVNLAKCEALAKSLENLVWLGKNLDKDGNWDHDFDAATYPIAFFEPAARRMTYQPAARRERMSKAGASAQ